MDNYAKQALELYNTTTVNRGETEGRPFWNINSSQFIFAPAFQFPRIPAAKKYLFIATDKNGAKHEFIDKYPTADLIPIWSEIPTGLVWLKVYGIDDDENILSPCGIREFFKADGFPGRTATAKKATNYKECSMSALNYVIDEPSYRYWIEKGVPDPEYYHNVYPSKMISSIVNAMIVYSKLNTERAEEAMLLAKNALDYLLSITYDSTTSVEGLPPTYSFKGLNAETVNATAPAAERCKDTVMMLYPASAGRAYINMYKATSDEKYLEAAKRIAEYYEKTVLPCGSWHLVIDVKTGKNVGENICSHFGILFFLNEMASITNSDSLRMIEEKYFAFISKKCLDEYKWEGQFEDIVPTGNYVNHTQLVPNDMLAYIIDNKLSEEGMLEKAKTLMNFIEDQFVVWGEFDPRVKKRFGGLNERWYSPAGLEQYEWYVPIDGSTTKIMNSFRKMYIATKDRLYLEKALTLGDMITKMQNKQTGAIPTHWMKADCTENLENFWINCHMASALWLYELSEFED